MHPRATKLLYFLVGGLVCGLSVALLRDTVYQGQDFEVFWRTARAVLSGLPAYDVARDGAMAFKYPPWILPLFFPLATVSLVTAKWIWAMGELLCLVVVARWLLIQGVSRWMLLGCWLGFWGLWAVHAMDGQINLLYLATALACTGQPRRGQDVFAVWALSAKLTTLIGWGDRLLKLRVRTILWMGLVFGLLSMPALLTAREASPAGLMRDWSEAARSGGAQFDGGKIRGRDNQGLPALVLRSAHVHATDARADVVVFFALALPLVAFWIKVSKVLNSAEQRAGWLALAAVTHPLAWFHLFVICFPLCVLCLDRTAKKPKSPEFWLAVLGTICVAAVTRKTAGVAGPFFELLSIKSLGTLMVLAALLISARRSIMEDHAQAKASSAH